MKRVFLYIFLIAAFLHGKAQQLQITNYTSKEGVPVYGVNSIFQDSKGWMWFTTGYEVIKYDGNRFRVIPLAVNTPMDFCYRIREVNKEIWVFSAPFVLKVSGDSLRKVEDRTDPSEVDDHLQFKGQSYFLGRQGLYQMNGNRFNQYITSGGLGGRPLQSLIAFNDSLLLSCQIDQRLVIFNIKKKSLHVFPLDVTAIKEDDNKNFFLLVRRKGIMQLKQIRWSGDNPDIEMDPVVVFDNNKYASFAVDGQGNFWTVDQFKELVKLDRANNRRTFNESHGLPSLWFNDMFVDREKNLWICFNGGLCKIRNTNWERYTASESLYSNHILFCAKGIKPEQVFVGTQNGVNIIENKQVRQVRLKGQPFICGGLIASSTSFYYFRDSVLYEGRIDTAHYIITSSKKITTLPGKCVQMLSDRYRNLIMATTLGLYGYSSQRLTRLTNDTSYFRSIMLDRENRLWAGKFGRELNCYRIVYDNRDLKLGELFSIDSVSPSMPRVIGIRGMAESSDGEIFVGTRNNGLFVLNLQNDKLINATHYGKEDGLGSNTVWDVAAAKDGSCWAAMTHGLSRMEKQNGQWKPSNESVKKQIFVATSIFIDPEDNIWVASHPGIVMARNDSGLAQKPFLVSVTGITINDNYLPSGELRNNRLQYAENNVRIEFSANTYRQEESVLYSFRLHDNDEWTTPSATHQVNYPALRPGKYRFSVKAINAEGQWSHNEASFGFSIIAPFWQQSWFIGLIIVIAAAGVYALYRYRLKRIKELFEMRNVIASDLHDEIGSTLTSINILSKVSHNNIGKDQQKASSLLKKVINQSQQIQENMSDIVWSIRPDNDKMENIILRMHDFLNHTLEPENIHVDFSVDDKIVKGSLSMQQRRDFFLVFKEAINNIAKYAKCTQVTVRLGMKEENIVMVIQDNGIGFDIDAINGTNGLRNMRHRASLLKGKIRIRSVMGNGTSVELEMPVV